MLRHEVLSLILLALVVVYYLARVVQFAVTMGGK